MPSRYTNEMLEGLRQIADPVPDSIIEALAEEGQLDQVNAILDRLMENYQPVPEELPDSIEFWLRDTATLPDWADPGRLERAADLFVEHGMPISLILSTSSLVESFAARKGVKALSCSYRMGHSTYRRIAETCQFVLLVLAPGGLFEGGRGIPAIQKVRLMHSAIRYLIRQTGRWNDDELGVPICQEDLLGTLMMFAYVVIRDLRQLGAVVSFEEAEDFVYFWRVVGEMLGVLPEVLPETFAEATTLTEAIKRRNQGPSPEGVALTRALLEMQADLIPGEALDGLMPALLRQLVGDQIADWMEVPRSRWEIVVRHKGTIGRLIDTMDRNSGVVADLIDKMSLALLTRQAISLNNYERAGFEIPTELLDAWAARGKM
jgi:hypothetical protein